MGPPWYVKSQWLTETVTYWFGWIDLDIKVRWVNGDTWQGWGGRINLVVGEAKMEVGETVRE